MKFEETYADNYKDCAWITFEDLEKFMKEALINAGIPEDDATTIGEILIESDKRV